MPPSPTAPTAKHQALLALRLQGGRPAVSEPIAIVGMSCRIPGGGDTPEAFWRLLADGVDAISEVPPQRWAIDDYFEPEPGTPGKMYSRWGAFLPDVDRFDAAYFGLSPREVMNMDPQQRLLLEVTWEALEDAGRIPADLKRSSLGVFVGVSTADYARIGLSSGDLARIDAYYGTGNSFSVAAGRIAYLLGTHGPALVVDTACSSSLVALHLACHSLRTGECELALAGGVSLTLVPETTVYFCALNALSRDGRCKAFDASADGYVRGDGAGIVVLKRLSAAIRDGDRIHAVVRGTAINHDGPSSGLTVPSGPAQEAVIRQALADAQVAPHQVSYVEAHGTGTPLGDPIEINALANVFGSRRDADPPLHVGSVKTNVGHLEAAAGCAGLLKVVLALKHRRIPPHLHLRTPSPRIEWSRLPFDVPTRLTEWKGEAGPLIAGVSSFGFSGTNAHVVVEQAPMESADRVPQASGADSERPLLLVFSAKSDRALQATASRYAQFLAESSASLTSIASTLARHRTHHPHRLSVAGAGRQEIVDALQSFAVGESSPTVSAGEPVPGASRIVFVFPGQGPEWRGMGAELFSSDPAFRAAIERCHAATEREIKWPLVDHIRSGVDAPWPLPVGRAHPLLLAIEYALFETWRAHGIAPAAVVGQSLGEIAAFVAAGALTIEQAMTLMCHRSALLERLAGRGRMAMVGLSRDRAARAMAEAGDALHIAVVRSPESVVVAGAPDAIDRFVLRLTSQGIFCRVVVDDIASHCPLVDEVSGELGERARTIAASPPSLPIYSSVTAARWSDNSPDAVYWQRNLAQPVLWDQTVRALFADGYDTFVEASPHPVLLSAIEETAGVLTRRVTIAPSLRRGAAEQTQLMAGAGRLHCGGVELDWSRFIADGPVVSLPPYAWDRERFWIDTPSASTSNRREVEPASGAARLRGRRIATPLEVEHHVTAFDAEGPPYLTDHRVDGTLVVAAASHVAMALALGVEAASGDAVSLTDVAFHQPMIVEPGVSLGVHTTVEPVGAGARALKVFSRPEHAATAAPWTLHATATIHTTPRDDQSGASTPLSAEVDGHLPIDGYWDTLSAKGYGIGPSFRWLDTLRRHGDEVVATLRAPGTEDEVDGYVVHPGLLDSCFQVLGAAHLHRSPDAASNTSAVFVPVSVEAIAWHRPGARPARCRARLHRSHAPDVVVGDLAIEDAAGAPIGTVTGLQAREVSIDRFLVSSASRVGRLLHSVEWPPSATVAPRAANLEGERCLVFGDRSDPAGGIAKVLREAGGFCAAVRAGARFERLGEQTWTIDPGNGDHYRRVLDEVCALAGPLTAVIYDARFTAADPIDGLVAGIDRCALAVIDLVRALTETKGSTPRLWIVTEDAQRVVDGDRVGGLEHAGLWGLGRTLAQELPTLRASLLDVDAEVTPEAIVASLAAADGEPQAALRRGMRHVARFAAIDLPIGERARIRAESRYLIAGAFGGLGLAVGDWLVDKGARALVLVGRRAPAGAAAAAVSSWRSRGVDVEVVIADVGDETQVRTRVAPLLRESPPLAGVVHAAGTLDDGVVLDVDGDRLHRVLGPKALGAWHLHEATRDLPLDFFVMFSSIAALFGPPGQAVHATANAWLDGLAHHRHARGLPALSINWSGWSEVGSAVGTRGAAAAAAAGMAPLRTALALDVLDRLLAQDRPQVAVADIDWPTWFRAWPAAREQRFFSTRAPADAASSQHEESGSVLVADLRAAERPHQRREMLERFLAQQIGRVLRQTPERIGRDTPFGALGFDSLMAIEVKTRLERALGITLPVSLVWNYPTVAEMAGFLGGELGVAVNEPADASISTRTPDDEAREREVAAMSEADVERLLSERLARLGKGA